MAKVLLQSVLNHRKGSSVVLIHSGVTKFDEEGKTEVDLSDEHLADLLDTYEDLSVFTDAKVEITEAKVDVKEPVVEVKEPEVVTEIAPQTEVNELGKSEDSKNDIGGSEDDTDDDLTSPLHNMKVDELKQLAIDSGFPEEEWKALKKPELKAYLLGKLQPQA